MIHQYQLFYNLSARKEKIMVMSIYVSWWGQNGRILFIHSFFEIEKNIRLKHLKVPKNHFFFSNFPQLGSWSGERLKFQTGPCPLIFSAVSVNLKVKGVKVEFFTLYILFRKVMFFIYQKMPQSGVGSMQGSNEDCLPMKGHTRGGKAPTVLAIEQTHRGGDAPTM